MKDIQNMSWSQWKELARLFSKYILVIFFFLLAIFYAFKIAPQELSKKSKSSSNPVSDRIEWNITTEKPQKVYPEALQGLAGDWYRMGVSTVASRDVRMDVILSGLWDENVLIGSLPVKTSNDFQYHEIIFQVPAGSFSDVKFVMRDANVSESWSYAGVKMSEFSLSRLNVRNKFEADLLMPTLGGTIEPHTQFLENDKRESQSGIILESRFVAEADFIKSIRVNARNQSKNSTYVLELLEYSGEGKERSTLLIKKMMLEPGEFGVDQDKEGNQSIIFPARLERGKEYVILFKGTGNASRHTSLVPLEGMSDTTSKNKNILAIVAGRYAHIGGGTLLSGAKVEDFGNGISYSYFPSGEVNDLFDLFDMRGNVKFDTKKKIVVGKQQQHTWFTYRFFTVHPFKKFMLSARQEGKGEKEIKLEYSLDNAFWREVSATQVSDEQTLFSLMLLGTGNQNTVYVRVSYDGEDKKNGVFGLDQLSVHAQLMRK